MNKQFYEEPKVSLIALSECDVLTSSANDNYEDDIFEELA